MVLLFTRCSWLTDSTLFFPNCHRKTNPYLPPIFHRIHRTTAPEITQLYAANFPASAIRAKVRKEYERNLLVSDLATIDILLLKGHQEFQEVSRFPRILSLCLLLADKMIGLCAVDGQLLEDGEVRFAP